MFDDEKKALFFADDEKKVIYSVAMRPNMLIPRKNINGEPAMVFYSEETVKDLQQNFFKQNYHNGSTINHNGKLDDSLYIFESWIVEDPEKDKATVLGLDVKKGDWVTGQKIDNDTVWQEVKDGKLTGFSIEAYLEPILTNNNEIKMTQEEIDARIRVVFAEEEEKKKEELPIAEPPKEEEEVIKAEEVPAEDPAAKMAAMQKTIDEKDAEINELKAKLSEIENKEIAMKAEIVKMQSEVEKGLKPTGGVAKDYTEMSNKEKALYNRGKL